VKNRKLKREHLHRLTVLVHVIDGNSYASQEGITKCRRQHLSPQALLSSIA
jgi:hypothetical protein